MEESTPQKTQNLINELDVLPNQSLGAEPSKIYIQVQGPAHIKPLPEDKLQVIFLDPDGNRKEKPIEFTLMPDSNFGDKILKVVSLQLILECDQESFTALKNSGELTKYFPHSYPEDYLQVDETPFNERGMNPPDPPIGKVKP